MKLNFEQITAVTQGAAYISKTDEGFFFHRFTKAEEDYYSSTVHAWKVFSTAGIQMVFKTDADSLSLSVTTEKSSSRQFFSFDVLQDNELCAEFKNFNHEDMVLPYVLAECPSGDFNWNCNFKKGEKTVRIVFPFSVASCIKSIVLENATFVEPVKRSSTMLMYGDSITHGYDTLNSSRAYSVQLSHMLDAEAFNKAIGGERFCPGLAAVKGDISPDYITVAYGTNDWSGVSAEELKENCYNFYKNIRENYPEAKVFAISPIWRADYMIEKPLPFSGVFELISDVAEKIGGITVIDGTNLVPHKEELYADLRLHPSDYGFDYYAKNLYNEIRKYI